MMEHFIFLIHVLFPLVPVQGAIVIPGLGNDGLSPVCPSGQWLNAGKSCKPCKACPPGQGVVSLCSSTHDTECEQCEKGKTFSRSRSYTQQCLPCHDCRNSLTIRYCKARHDAVCGRCQPGYFTDNAIQMCRKCSFCYPERPGLTIRTVECMVPGQPRDYQCLPTVT